MEGDEDTKWIQVQKNGREDALLGWRGKEEGNDHRTHKKWKINTNERWEGDKKYERDKGNE
jgi:hypothetical protein